MLSIQEKPNISRLLKFHGYSQLRRLSSAVALKERFSVKSFQKIEDIANFIPATEHSVFQGTDLNDQLVSCWWRTYVEPGCYPCGALSNHVHEQFAALSFYLFCFHLRCTGVSNLK